MKHLWSIFLVFLNLSCCSFGRRIPWKYIKIAQEQGPNVCVVEEIPGTNKQYWTECKYWSPREICGKTAMLRYECCEGYEMLEGEDGCTGVLPLTNVVETAKRLGATKFVEYLQNAKLDIDLTKEGAYTLLAPTNEALENAPREVLSQLDLYSHDPRNPPLLYHLTEGRVTSDDINRDLMVESRSSGSKLRFNAYATGVVTVNCVPIVRKDQQASNGVVHLIDSVLNPSMYTGKTVVDTIAEDGRFSELSKALESTGYVSQLQMQGYPFSFFSPSDEAFQKIPSERLEKIMSDREARKALLESHMIPHPICPSAIHKESKMRSMSSEKLTFNCDDKGQYVEDLPLGREYLLGLNGIVHVINDVIIPDRAKSLTELLESHGLWTFLSLINQAGLYETFSNYGDYTMFAPSEEAFEALGDARMAEIRQDVEYLRKFIMYHCTQGRVTTSIIADNQEVMSLDEENPLRLQVYRKGIGVENALMEKQDIEGQNGVVHVISKVMEAPKQSAGELLRSLGTHNIFLTMMETVTNSKMQDLGQEMHKSYTFLAPSDEAFQEIDQVKLDSIMKNEEYLSQLVKNHIVNRILCSNSFNEKLKYTAKSKLNDLSILRQNDRLQINGANVVQADLMTTNGVVYLIDQVLMPTKFHEESSYTNSSTTIITGRNGTTTYNRTITRTVTHYENSGNVHSYSSSSSSHSSSDGGGSHHEVYNPDHEVYNPDHEVYNPDHVDDHEEEPPEDQYDEEEYYEEYGDEDLEEDGKPREY